MARSERIEIRLSPAEKAEWSEAAAAEERKVGDFVRLTVNAFLRERRSPAFPVPVPDAAPIPPSEWPEKTVIVLDEQHRFSNEQMEDFAKTLTRFGAAPPAPPEDGGSVPTGETTATSMASPADEPTEPPCPSRAFHLKGRYCKVCGRVPE